MQSIGSHRDHPNGDDEDFDEYVDQQVRASSGVWRHEGHAVAISPL